MSDKEELRYKDERSGILVNGVGAAETGHCFTAWVSRKMISANP